jgi:hypothetical protein
MGPTVLRTLFGGLGAFVAFVVALSLTFALFGGSRRGQTGLLFDPETQRAKLIAVWKEIEPLPLLIEKPIPIFAGYLAFALSTSWQICRIETMRRSANALNRRTPTSS